MGYEKRWDYPWHSSGEVVTAEKLRLLATAPRDSVLDLLGDLYVAPSGIKRSGVVSGFGVSPTVANMTLHVGRGLGFAYNPVKDVLGQLAIEPVVNEAPQSVVLEAPDGTNPRYDLIVARPAASQGDYQTRSVRLSDGTLTTQSLPQWWDVGCEIRAITGTPGVDPICPEGTLGDIPLAVVYVRPGAPHPIEASDVYDVRWWLRYHQAGPSQYVFSAKCNGTDSLSNINQYVTDPNISVAATISRTGVGSYTAVVQVLASALGTHPNPPWVLDAMAISFAGCVSEYPNGTRLIGYSSGLSSPFAGGALRYVSITMNVYDSSGAPIDISEWISGSFTFFRAD